MKCVYNTKRNTEENIERHKTRLVVKGYKQQHGTDYVLSFALIMRMETMCIVVSVYSQHKWKLYQMDVESMFLNEVLNEGVHVAQPLGYELEGQEDKVYRFMKSLYGLKQALHAWYYRIGTYLLDNGFNKYDGEHTLYIKESKDSLLIVVLYVDDLIFIGSDDFLICYFK